jgi:hypothetical protein
VRAAYMRVWGMLKIEDRIKEDTVVSAETFEESLLQVCECFDLTKPIMLKKHQTEIQNFRRTIFYPDDFIEPVNFDTLELEIITKKKKTPR